MVTTTNALDPATEMIYRAALTGELPKQHPLKEKAEQELEKEILESVLTSKHLRVGLSQIARVYGVPFEVVEQVASTLTQKHLGQDLERIEFEQVARAIANIEQNEHDPGVREWKMQALARRFRRSPQQLMQAYNKALFQKQLQPKSVADFKRDHQQDINWLVQGWIPQGVTVLLYGDGGAGKTLMAYQLLEAVLHGKPWNGYQVRQGSALLVQCDEPELVTAERLDIRGIDDNAPLFVLSDWSTEQIGQLEHWISEHKPEFVIIDSVTTINRFSIFKESDTEYARPILQLRDMARAHGCTIFLLHHSNAAGEARGTRAIHNSVDEVWGLTKTDGDQRVVKVGKTRLGRPPGRYRFTFEDDYTFRYLGEESSDGDYADDVTQEEKIRLWLSEDERRGTAFASIEVSESLQLSKDSCRRALYELWARGLIRRRRPKNSPYYLYFVKKDEGDREAIASYTPLKPTPPEDSSRQAIGRSLSHQTQLNENEKTHDHPDRLSATTETEQGFEASLTSDRLAPKRSEPIENEDPTSPSGGEGPAIGLEPLPQVGDVVIVKGEATWFRSGSDKLPWQQVPKSHRSENQIPIKNLGLHLFDELCEGGKVIKVGRDKVHVRNQRTGRNSIFLIQDVAVLKPSHRC